MPAQLSDVATQLKQLRGSLFWGGYSGNTDSLGFFTFAHGAPFVPGAVLCFPNGAAASPNLAFPFTYATTATTVTLSFFAVAGSAAALAVAGSFLCLP